MNGSLSGAGGVVKAHSRTLRRSSAWVAWFLPAMVGPSGCGGEVDTAGGRQAGPSLEVEPVLSVGATAGPDSVLFQSVVGICTDGIGNLHLVDLGDFLVRVFSPDGTLLRTFGGSGEAPFEFGGVLALACLPNGSTVVLDVRPPRAKLFDPQGRFLRSWPLPSGIPIRGQRAVRVLSHDRIALGISASFGEDGRVPWPRPLYVIHDTLGAVLDTIWGPADLAAECGNPSELQYQSGFLEDVRSDWVRKMRWTLLRDGSLAIACSGEPRFHIIRPGEERGTVELPLRDLPEFPREARQDLLRVLRGGNAAVPPFQVPVDQPPIADLLASKDGGLWILGPRVYHEIHPEDRVLEGDLTWVRGSGGPVFWYGPDQELRGSFELPHGLFYRPDWPPVTEPEPVGDGFWAIGLDELDVQRIVRFRVTPDVAGKEEDP